MEAGQSAQKAVALKVTDLDGRTLVLWHKKHRFWTVPLGKIEDHEPAGIAAIREAKEELGIDVEDSKLICTCTKRRTSGQLIVFSIFEISSYRGEIQNIEAEKHDSLRFLLPQEIGELGPLSYPTELISGRALDSSVAPGA